jgi:hypothetical protein
LDNPNFRRQQISARRHPVPVKKRVIQSAHNPPLPLISAPPKVTAFSLPHGKIREKIRLGLKIVEIHRK